MILEPGKLIHTRTYDVNTYVVDDQHFVMVGRINDVKPDGLWGIKDPNPMSLHDMTLRVTVRVADLTITAVETTMTTHPQRECPLILPAYDQLVGLSIARGFSQKVKELFGGPRACTHIGALINAMAPVAMQTVWAYTHLVFDNTDESVLDADERARRMRIGQERNKNTCHVYAENGPVFTRIMNGEVMPPPIWAEQRLAELGIPIDQWQSH